MHLFTPQTQALRSTNLTTAKVHKCAPIIHSKSSQQAIVTVLTKSWELGSVLPGGELGINRRMAVRLPLWALTFFSVKTNTERTKFLSDTPPVHCLSMASFHLLLSLQNHSMSYMWWLRVLKSSEDVW